eukprot:253852-Rhodomonas_salina.2
MDRLVRAWYRQDTRQHQTPDSNYIRTLVASTAETDAKTAGRGFSHLVLKWRLWGPGPRVEGSRDHGLLGSGTARVCKIVESRAQIQVSGPPPPL